MSTELVSPEFWDVLDEYGNNTGRFYERTLLFTNGHMSEGEYHLIVHIWIINNNGEFLISQRAPNKSQPYMWECTGGCAVAGDDSLTTALKEVKEELGVTLDPKNGELFKRYKRVFNNGSGDFVDVWVFRQNVLLSDVIFQEGETCDAMLAGKKEILRMIDDGIFVGREYFPYYDEFFNAVATDSAINFTLRKVLLEDAYDYAALHIACWRDAYAGIISYEYLNNMSAELEQRVEKAKQMLSTHSDWEYYCAEYGNDMVGRLIYGKSQDEDKPDAADITAIYLLADYWGKGFGKQMMDFAITELSGKGFREFTLWVLEANSRARRFYENYGFVCDGATKELVIGEPMTVVRYTLSR